MALPTLHRFDEVFVGAHSASIGTSPVAAWARSPIRGKITKLVAVTAGTITGADCSVACAINGTSITGGTITITFTGAAAGQVFSATPTATTTQLVSEDDGISFTASGSSGSSIPCTFYAHIQRAE